MLYSLTKSAVLKRMQKYLFCFRNTFKQMLIIGIAGGTGSGKTTVVKKIIESLPASEVVLLPQDSYYKDSSHVPVEERQYINFDHPDAFEWSLLSKHVAMLREGKSIEQPTYSYLTCSRLPETIHIEPHNVIIIEGILALCDKKLRNMMDLKVLSMPTRTNALSASSSATWWSADVLPKLSWNVIYAY